MGKIQIREKVTFDGYEQLKAIAAGGREVQVGKVVYHDNARIPPDGAAAHSEDEYVFVVKGGVTFGVGGECYDLQEGDFHYLPRGVEHWCRGIGESGEFLYILVKEPTAAT